MFSYLSSLQQDELTSFGIDWDGPSPSPEWGSLPECEGQGIIIPEVTIPFADESISLRLSQLIDLRESTNFGVDLYEQALEFVLSSQE